MRDRVFDVVMGAAGALLATPLILVFALVGALVLRGNPFFVHTRIGLDGRRFRMVKLRTLPKTAPRYADKYEIGKIPIPGWCQFLRRTHLDELPQLFLVVLGRMSLVGPRPEMPDLHEGMPAHFADSRTLVRPGCTGLWQISDAQDGLIHEAPQYDRFYLSYRSLRLDLWILVTTVLQAVRLRSRIDLTDVPQWVTSSDLADVVPLPAHRRVLIDQEAA